MSVRKPGFGAGDIDDDQACCAGTRLSLGSAACAVGLQLRTRRRRTAPPPAGPPSPPGFARGSLARQGFDHEPQFYGNGSSFDRLGGRVGRCVSVRCRWPGVAANRTPRRALQRHLVQRSARARSRRFRSAKRAVDVQQLVHRPLVISVASVVHGDHSSVGIDEKIGWQP